MRAENRIRIIIDKIAADTCSNTDIVSYFQFLFYHSAIYLESAIGIGSSSNIGSISHPESHVSVLVESVFYNAGYVSGYIKAIGRYFSSRHSAKVIEYLLHIDLLYLRQGVISVRESDELYLRGICFANLLL